MRPASRSASGPDGQQGRVTSRRGLVRRLLAITLLTLVAVAGIALVSDQATLLLHRQRQAPVTANLAQEIETFIVRTFSHSALDLVKLREVVEVCAGRAPVDNPELQRVLNTAQGALDVALVYVLDPAGTVIGSSVSAEEPSLTGNRYHSRPYFTYAMAGTPHVFPAVGLTTGRKGFYFSAPVYADDRSKPIGVLVIKTRSNLIDDFFRAQRTTFDAMLLSPDGVVFAATRDEWQFRTAWPLREGRRLEIRSSRQFRDYPLEPLPFALGSRTVAPDGMRLNVETHPLPINGWRVATLEPVPFPWTIVVLLSCIAVALGVLFGLIAVQGYREEQLAVQVRAGREASDRAEAARRNSVRELETIFSTSLVGIALVRNGRIVNANRRLCEIFGYTREELRAGTIRLLFPSRRSFRRFVRRYIRLLMGSDVEQVEYLLRKKDGTVMPCVMSGKAINPDDLAQGTVWVIEDISRRKEGERELEQARVAAEAASVAKGQFLANMSHEIRTPMNGIIGLANILLGEQMPPGQREHLELIRRSAVRLLTIINDVLDFSRLEAGRFELERRPFSLRGMLSDVLRPMEPTARRKNLELRTTVAPEVPATVVGDQNKLVQVLTNLVGNSLKFTRKGMVEVRVDRQAGEGADASDRLLFAVIDTGPGIVPAYQKRVFESFTQADSSHSRRFGGTGLGLSISRGLVELMGGTIWFESEPGRGTQFSFTVPLVTLESSGLVDSREEEPALRPDDGSLEGDGWHILVAEDEYINKILIRTLLQQAGYHVTVVQNGREAVEAWRGGVFDCILMDIQMPFMDGYEAVARIRAQEQEGEHIPVIAMTAHAMSGDRQKCLQAGMDDYLAKPIDGRAVLALLRRFLRDRSAPADGEGAPD